jgi:hypothetical protein
MLTLRPGLGLIDVEPLGQAMMSGALAPSFEPQVSYQPTYLPAGQETQLPTWVYATSAFASQIAGYLGGSVVQAPPPIGFQGDSASPLPLANWISADGQQILPGNIFQPGVVLAFDSLCAAENYLTDSIPGSEFGPSCASYATSTPNPNPLSGGTQAPVAPPAANPPAAPPASPAPVNTTTTDSPNPPVSGSGSPAPPLGAGDNSQGGSGTGNPNTTATPVSCFNPISQWLSMDSCLGPLGIVEWGLLALGAVLLLSGGRR